MSSLSTFLPTYWFANVATGRATSVLHAQTRIIFPSSSSAAIIGLTDPERWLGRHVS